LKQVEYRACLNQSGETYGPIFKQASGRHKLSGSIDRFNRGYAIATMPNYYAIKIVRDQAGFIIGASTQSCDL
jgi:hypothetical protein